MIQTPRATIEWRFFWAAIAKSISSALVCGFLMYLYVDVLDTAYLPGSSRSFERIGTLLIFLIGCAVWLFAFGNIFIQAEKAIIEYRAISGLSSREKQERFLYKLKRISFYAIWISLLLTGLLNENRFMAAAGVAALLWLFLLHVDPDV